MPDDRPGAIGDRLIHDPSSESDRPANELFHQKLRIRAALQIEESYERSPEENAEGSLPFTQGDADNIARNALKFSLAAHSNSSFAESRYSCLFGLLGEIPLMAL